MITKESSLAGDFQRSAALISGADGLLIATGAGMGVDSGLPDFRGPGGFWGVYPGLGRLNMEFQDIANPASFRQHPRLAWGFYGHRLKLYRKTNPNEGFGILQHIGRSLPQGAFVFTSNVDGQFQKAGFPENRICEAHGSIHHLQCLEGCNPEIWPAGSFEPQVNEALCLLTNDLPLCPQCGNLARPNILMFNDWQWRHWRTQSQRDALNQWMMGVRRGVVIEIGAGSAIPTVRNFSENLGWPVIRINPAESDLNSAEGVRLPLGATSALKGILEALQRMGFPGRSLT